MEGLTAFNSEEEVLDGYQVLKITGKGSFGQVALAHHLESGTQVAVKMIATGGQNSRRFQQFCAEAEIMKGLHHPHIIKLLQLRHTAQRGYIFMEYAIKGDLRCYLIERGCLQDEEIRPIFYQTLSAVHYCHEQRIVHRDLKLENLLLDDNLNIKLTDFGLSCKLADGEHLKCLRGTLHYCAPEEFRAEAFNGYKADVWSLGVVLYTMVTKSLPFEGKDFVHLKETILSAYYRIPSYVNIELENLLDRLLTRNPEERPTVADIMGHQWLRVGHKAPETSEEFLFPPKEQEIWEFPWGPRSQSCLKERDDPLSSVPHCVKSPQKGYSMQELWGHREVEPVVSPQGPEALSCLEDLGFQLDHKAGSLPPRLQATSLPAVLQKGHTKVKPMLQATPAAQSCPILQCLPGHSDGNIRAHECALCNSQPLLLEEEQSGQNACHRAPSMSSSVSCRPDSPQMAMLPRILAAWAAPSKDSLTSLSMLNSNSSDDHFEVRSCSRGASEKQSIPGMQQEEGTSDTQAKKSKSRQGIGRRIVRFFTWICCILPAPEESP
ncbi:MAP/microtubule affinity-regulating kinase 3-like [Oryctolagus cuniculus]|uniref:MAP/microtubule affinity-regulating kinase 3-like n=1 Tax=Oryctolagus cuniculus TaxID=9986 RepID=UPI0001CE216F|nr:MAP/microtubule affinity-regulating kinase 3 [Oryctolagus cuniculus]XP_051690982.1 MAP/microtubule affinity-regulating kinase 3 [Oryctolagus cuniculus]XP_051690983.1 MAP/microtubule affinity-regulating kinase 3 [Oryctolagus cuniculus]XP_051690984.1 MAP/microtubule affinity-regulating kinase 3 [Oryctolagus cuniculus]XP_051690985.1 MAP/microtubule affinity-regulating kinase 3 [Oryctolagus cuniculus]XP_051690986.1 MAP/microtubule affinity-regulating kinase 3 [Oryctolagus cuniculus]XP_05169098